ncbi:MAG: hypothetical protein AB7G80_01100 [Dongiaceae bacterium]
MLELRPLLKKPQIIDAWQKRTGRAFHELPNLLRPFWPGHKRDEFCLNLGDDLCLSFEHSGGGGFQRFSLGIAPEGALQIHGLRAFPHSKGFGKEFMRWVIGFAEEIKRPQLELVASEVGRYFWARAGFIPDEPAWDTIRQAALVYLRQEEYLLGRDVWVLEKILHNPNPAAIRNLACQTIMGWKDGQFQEIAIGKDMLLDAPGWGGLLDLTDPVARRQALEYCRPVLLPAASLLLKREQIRMRA